MIPYLPSIPSTTSAMFCGSAMSLSSASRKAYLGADIPECQDYPEEPRFQDTKGKSKEARRSRDGQGCGISTLQQYPKLWYLDSHNERFELAEASRFCTLGEPHSHFPLLQGAPSANLSRLVRLADLIEWWYGSLVVWWCVVCGPSNHQFRPPSLVHCNHDRHSCAIRAPIRLYVRRLELGLRESM